MKTASYQYLPSRPFDHMALEFDCEVLGSLVEASMACSLHSTEFRQGNSNAVAEGNLSQCDWRHWLWIQTFDEPSLALFQTKPSRDCVRKSISV